MQRFVSSRWRARRMLHYAEKFPLQSLRNYQLPSSKIVSLEKTKEVRHKKESRGSFSFACCKTRSDPKATEHSASVLQNKFMKLRTKLFFAVVVSRKRAYDFRHIVKSRTC